MTTRSGTPYQHTQVSPTVTMDPSLETLMNAMTEQFKQLNARFDQVEERIVSLEESRMTPIEPQSPRLTPIHPRAQRHDPTPDPHPLHPRAQRHETAPDHHQRRPHNEFAESEERALRSIRLDAPTFDGNLDPKIYIDWESDLDQYFEWYEMSEERKFKFAKMKLVRQARLFWGNVERLYH